MVDGVVPYPWGVGATGFTNIAAEHHPEGHSAQALLASNKVNDYRQQHILVLERRFGIQTAKAHPSSVIASIDHGPLGMAGPISFTFTDGSSKTLAFGDVEGRLEI